MQQQQKQKQVVETFREKNPELDSTMSHTTVIFSLESNSTFIGEKFSCQSKVSAFLFVEILRLPLSWRPRWTQEKEEEGGRLLIKLINSSIPNERTLLSSSSSSSSPSFPSQRTHSKRSNFFEGRFQSETNAEGGGGGGTILRASSPRYCCSVAFKFRVGERFFFVPNRLVCSIARGAI